MYEIADNDNYDKDKRENFISSSIICHDPNLINKKLSVLCSPSEKHQKRDWIALLDLQAEVNSFKIETYAFVFNF